MLQYKFELLMIRQVAFQRKCHDQSQPLVPNANPSVVLAKSAKEEPPNVLKPKLEESVVGGKKKEKKKVNKF